MEVTMKKKNKLRAIILSCTISLIASGTLAQDWPQWRGVNRDGKLIDFTAPEKWPEQLTQRWKVTVGSGDATPALVGDRLYVFTRQGEDEVIRCLNAFDGKEHWKTTYPAQAVSGPASRHPGPRSSPTVAGGMIVTIGVGGVLSCFDTGTGNLVWRKDPFPKVVPRFFTSFSPMVVDDMVVAYLGGAGNGAIIAYDLATGNEKWRWTEEGPDYGSPVLLTVTGTKQIVTPTEKSIVGINLADGKLAWQHPFAPKMRAYNAATPIVDGQLVIITGAGRGTTVVKIEKQEIGFAAKALWSIPDLAPQFNTPVLKDDLLFGLTDRSRLYCINARTGQTAWTDDTAHGTGGFGSIVDVGSCLALLTNDSELIIFKPESGEYSEIKRYKVAETPTYAQPVISDNRVFIKDQDSLVLWMIN